MCLREPQTPDTRLREHFDILTGSMQGKLDVTPQMAFSGVLYKLVYWVFFVLLLDTIYYHCCDTKSLEVA